MIDRFFALRHLATACLLASLASVPAAAGVDGRMFRYPDVSATSIAFVYAGDIWVVAKDGGTASRLSSPPGEESFPRFSPDGSRIAFSAAYDGNTDVYVVPAAGGTPERVTYHPSSDRLLGWSADGEDLLFASRRTSGLPVGQLFRVPAAGGLAAKLPLAYGEFAALAADGRRLAFTTKAREFSTWKRYRGGLAPDIWLLDLETLAADNLTASDANDVQPMWHGETLYFLSDRGAAERTNVWALDLATGSFRQVTRFTDFDVTFPAIGPSDIVFQAGGRLHLLELADETHRQLAIEVVTDLATLKPRRLDVGGQVASADVSPSGARAVVEARGEIFTVPAENGVVRQLTHRSASAERTPAWSPDGESVAYWSDRSGEYELVIRDARGAGEEQTLTELGAGYRYRPFWSPDSKRIAFLDNTQTIRIVDVESRELVRVDQGRRWIHTGLQGIELAWSADSRFLAYHRHLQNELTAIFLFDTRDNALHQVTSGYYRDSGPVFDPGGELLYYRSERHLEPIYSSYDGTWVYANATRLVAVPLTGEVASPLAPRNDEEGEEKKDGDEGGDGDEEKKEPKKGKKGKKDQDEEEEGEDEDEIEPLEIDLEGFEERAVVLPPAAGNYGALRAVAGKLVFQRLPRSGAGGEERPIVFYDLEEREEKTVLADAEGFEVSADGKKLLVAAAGSWAIVDLAPEAKIEQPLALGELQTVVDPRREWRQMFDDVWRTYRDNFYDPAMHGLDWGEVRERYGELLDDAVTRWDVNFVLGEVIAELNASHTYVFGGDVEQPERRPVGLLGIDWELADGAYRIAHIVRGGAWDTEVRSTLAEPGLGIAEGDYILAVNGVTLDTGKAPHAAFAGLAGETVELLVNGSPSLEGARQVLVETLSSERELRQRAWVEANRRRVAEATDGRVGYVYVRDTSLGGQADLVRQFTSQATTDGLVIDERWNQGGQLPDRFVELMTRQRVIHLAFRYQDRPVAWPAGTHYGPKAMLINGWAGSGGDAFPFFFRQMGAGPLIGQRTWGGLIGPAFPHRLVDGGVFTAPPGRLYGPDGVWFPEGRGVEPDILVVDDPGELAKGRDPQLEAAIAEVAGRLEAEAPRFPGPPPFESRVPEAPSPEE